MSFRQTTNKKEKRGAKKRTKLSIAPRCIQNNCTLSLLTGGVEARKDLAVEVREVGPDGVAGHEADHASADEEHNQRLPKDDLKAVRSRSYAHTCRRAESGRKKGGKAKKGEESGRTREV